MSVGLTDYRDAYAVDRFVYIGALTANTPATSPPSTTIGSEYKARTGAPNTFVESAIWSYDPISGSLTPQWINPTGDSSSSPATAVGYIEHTGMHIFMRGRATLTCYTEELILSGDLDAYNLRASAREELMAQEVVSFLALAG